MPPEQTHTAAKVGAGVAVGFGSGCAGMAGLMLLGAGFAAYGLGDMLANSPGDNIGIGAFLGPIFQIAGFAGMGLGAIVVLVAVVPLVLGAAGWSSTRRFKSGGT